MAKHAFLAVLILAAVAAFVSAEDKVVAKEYDADTFKSELPKSNHFVMFYAPWCGHCKRLHPTWEELAEKYNDKEDSDAVIAKVDCTVHTAVCSDQDVTGYPTLKFFKKGEDSGEKYRGQRDLKALSKFVGKQLGLEVEEEEAVVEPEIAVADKGLYTLNEKSFANHIKTGDTFVKFYAPWCGHCQKLAPTWEDLAKDFESDKDVTIAKLDCTAAGNLCQENDVKGYPTLAYFRNGKKLENYRGARNLKELKDFVKSMRDVKASADDDKDKVPEKTDVRMLNEDGFEEAVASAKVVFVKFFAPWCGHCKRLAPTWEELAGKYASNDKVVIAKVDCTSDDNKNKKLCSAQGVSGFPTLNIYVDGKKAEEYSGKRELDLLSEFVEKHLAGEKAKDEL